VRVVSQHPLQQGAQVGGGGEIAAFVKAFIAQARPIAQHPTAVQGTTGQQGHARRTMVGATGAVGADGPAELGDHGDQGLIPHARHADPQGHHGLRQLAQGVG